MDTPYFIQALVSQSKVTGRVISKLWRKYNVKVTLAIAWVAVITVVTSGVIWLSSLPPCDANHKSACIDQSSNG